MYEYFFGTEQNYIGNMAGVGLLLIHFSTIIKCKNKK